MPSELALALCLACGSEPGPADRAARTAPPQRLAQVAERGSRVMPFDLERTTHVFEPAASGGVQTVVADDPADTTQVRLVREHLREESRRFAAGDFTDPARVHGDAMPGLAELRPGHGQITVRYDAIPAGARIHYATTDPELVRALHDWFAAQTSDHGPHAHPPPAS